ncbi:MAG: PHP domain-containing protein, partial [Burkholderiales bacterium]
MSRCAFALTACAERDKINRMSTPSFVHLRLHSEYSVSDGIVRLDDAVEAAVADGMPALALTDLANMFGMV